MILTTWEYKPPSGNVSLMTSFVSFGKFLLIFVKVLHISKKQSSKGLFFSEYTWSITSYIVLRWFFLHTFQKINVLLEWFLDIPLVDFLFICIICVCCRNITSQFFTWYFIIKEGFVINRLKRLMSNKMSFCKYSLCYNNAWWRYWKDSFIYWLWFKPS